jgi:alpha-L-fucosidase
LWYDEAKFGIFCHWGVYSVPAFANGIVGGSGGVNLAEWLWWDWYNNASNILDFMKTHYRPSVKYADFAKDVSIWKDRIMNYEPIACGTLHEPKA